jgi:hypothetical protein
MHDTNGAGRVVSAETERAARGLTSFGRQVDLLATLTRGQIQEAVRAELRRDDTAMALGIKAIGYAPVIALCRALLKAGTDPTLPLEVWRGNVLALTVRSIGKAALLTVTTGRNGAPVFVRHAPRGSAAASPVRPPKQPAGGVAAPALRANARGGRA